MGSKFEKSIQICILHKIMIDSSSDLRYMTYPSERILMEPNLIQRRRVTDQIIDNIVSMIASGKLKRGDKLPCEHALMKQFGVGRSSLREAVGELSLVGLLSVRPGHGTHVTVSPDAFLAKPLGWNMLITGHDKIHELIEARLILEEAMIGLAAERATEDDIAEIRYHQARLKASMRPGQRSVKADLAFHTAIAKASHNIALTRFFSELRQPVRHWMEQKASVIEGYHLVAEQHDEILRAIEAHDVERARSALRNHLRSTSEKLVSILLKKQL
jgi:GntR family transcriptional repressor for pyruvate dehydrogenase complex